jgi:hypothetical protein
MCIFVQAAYICVQVGLDGHTVVVIDLPCKVDGGSPTKLFGINDAWASRRWRRLLVQEGLHLIGVSPHRVTLDPTLVNLFLAGPSVTILHSIRKWALQIECRLLQER